MLGPIVYQPFFPAILLQGLKGLPQDQADQLETDTRVLQRESKKDWSAQQNEGTKDTGVAWIPQVTKYPQ